MRDVSVLIVNLNQKDLLVECLRSLRRTGVRIQTIVVDNGSTDGSAEAVRKEFPDAELLVNKRNERFAKPNNDAFARAEGRFIFLLNNDTVVRPQALEILVDYLERHQDVAMVGPQLLNPDGTIQPSCHRFPNLRTHVCDMLALDRLFPRVSLFSSTLMTFFDHKTEREVDHVTAAAALVRSDVLKQAGLFDEEFSIYYNDVDLSYRLKKEGWKTAFVPTAQVMHHGGRTADPLKMSWEYFREQYRNIFFYYDKHHGRAKLILYKIILFLGFVPRALLWTIVSRLYPSPRSEADRQFSVWTLRVLLSPGPPKHQ